MTRLQALSYGSTGSMQMCHVPSRLDNSSIVLPVKNRHGHQGIPCTSLVIVCQYILPGCRFQGLFCHCVDWQMWWCVLSMTAHFGPTWLFGPCGRLTCCSSSDDNCKFSLYLYIWICGMQIKPFDT